MSSVRDVFVASFLLDEAGDGALARGVVNERDGRVKIVTKQPGRVSCSYPLPMVLAEKLVTAVARGTANTR